MKVVYVVWREEVHKPKREFCIAETPLAAIRALLAMGQFTLIRHFIIKLSLAVFILQLWKNLRTNGAKAMSM